ncbi:MAG: ATP-binding protein [Propionicimonas sp.]|uniref:ATP-binding protein n=1 Tax=Propionicimonas sp. TaxID=1955623 RepID=UPI003D14CC1B
MTVHQDRETSGRLSVDDRNTFGLLTDALYDEPGVVFRELVSNAFDAIGRRAALDPGAPAGRVLVALDTERGTLDVRDNGIGMSADEVRRYLNQVAWSGTAEHLRQWQDAGASAPIGQFGVGFYSAFMLAPTVEVHTRSVLGEEPVRWTCTREMEWRIGAGERAEAGTTVLLHLDADSPYLTHPARIREALLRWFPFPRVPLELRVDDAEPEAVGDLDPAWRRPDATAAELDRFYREHFGEADDPVGVVPLGSPDLGLRGMVFLRDTHGGADAIDGRVEVFSRGVHVGTDLRALVPKFANLQHAVIECDRLPLVVSRGQVRGGGTDDVAALVAECLSQELAIALHGMFTEDRARYEVLWPELAPFVKYGVLTDRIFGSVMTRRILFPGIDGTLRTVAEYLDQVAGTHPGTVFYVSDPVGQAAAVEAFRHAGVPALVLDHVIDQPLLQRLEAVTKDVRFTRLDADIAHTLAGDPDPADAELAGRVVDRFERHASDRLPGARFAAVRLRVPDLPVVLSSEEDVRRMSELARMGGLLNGRETSEPVVPQTLVLNLHNPLVRRIGTAPEPVAALAAAQLADLTLLGQDELSPESLLGFLARSQAILADYLGAGPNE